MIWSFFSFSANIFLQLIKKDVKINELKKEFIEIFLYARSVWFFIILFIASMFLASFAYSKIKYWKLICMLIWLVIIFLPLELGDVFLFYKFKFLFPFMILGYCVSEYKTQFKVQCKPRNISYGIYGTISLCVFLSLTTIAYDEKMFTTYSMSTYGNYMEVITGIGYYLISLIGILACLLLSYKFTDYKKISTLLGYVGQRTEDIYVIHMFMIKFVTLKIVFTGISLHIFSIIYSGIIIIVCLCIRRMFQNLRIYNFTFGR